MDNYEPSFSIGMPVYNSGQETYSAIDKILNQTFTNSERIIFDNDSTDTTQLISEEYASNDLRVKHLELLRRIVWHKHRLFGDLHFWKPLQSISKTDWKAL